MKQRWLPGFGGPESEESASCDGDSPEERVDGALDEVPVLPGQIALFTAERELLGLMESAIVDGRFEEALGFREALAIREGPSRETSALLVLDRLGDPAFWKRPLTECVDGWLSLERTWEAAPLLHDLVRDAVLVRLMVTHDPATIVRARPSLLAPLVNLLGKQEPDALAAGTVLRDALLGGASPRSEGFDDPAFVDLLAENCAPQWLACIGALRRLWPVPTPAADVDVSLPLVPDDDEERGLQFWRCLQVAAWNSRDSVTATEARKRMKLLDPSLHAQFMRQGVWRD